MLKCIKQIFSKIGSLAFIIIVSIFFLFPILWLLLTTFKTSVQATAIPPVWFFTPTLNAYIKFFRGESYASISGICYLNSAIFATLTTVICLILGSTGAYAFARTKFKSAYIISIIVLILRMIPTVVILIPLYIMMRNLNMIDTIPAVVLAHVGINLPFVTWLLKSFFNGIPVELEEAALIDGCSFWQTFYKIALPLTVPGLATAAILTAQNSWNEFLCVLVLTRANLRPVSVALATVNTGYEFDWTLLATGGFLALLPVVIFAFLVQKHFVRGLTLGALK